MKRINKYGIKRKLNIVYIHNNSGKQIMEILKEGYLNHLKNYLRNKLLMLYNLYKLRYL